MSQLSCEGRITVLPDLLQSSGFSLRDDADLVTERDESADEKMTSIVVLVVLLFDVNM